MKRLFTYLLDLVEFFLPIIKSDNVDEEDRRRRAQILVTFCLLSGLSSILIPVTLSLIEGDIDRVSVVIMSFGLLLLLNPVLMKIMNRFELISYLFYIESGALIAGHVMFSGGINSPALVTFILWPVGASFIAGRGLGIFSTFLVIACLTLLLVIPDFFESIKIPTNDEYNVFLFACFTSTLIFSAIVNWSYETFQNNFKHRMNQLLKELRVSQADLIEAKQIAETANSTKSEFLANMSHEIRTPMNGVLGMTTLLVSSNLTDEQQDLVTTIQNSSEDLLTIVNDILDFSKVEAGKLEIIKEPFNLRTSIEEVLDLLAAKALAKNVEVVLQFPESVPNAVIGDKSRVKQIISNLLSNAVKFTEQGQILISVSHDARHRFHIEVIDTGIGISESQLQRLFSSFEQADAHISTRFGGTGLGLAISRQLSRLMEGDIWAESTKDKGSTFHCTLGLATDESAVSLRTKIVSDKPAHVLVASASNVLGNNICQLAQAWGLTIDTTQSSEEVLHRLKEKPTISLLIIDENLSDMNSLQFTTQQTFHELKDKPKIVLLLQPERLDQVIAEEYRDHIVLKKPVRAEKLYAIFTESLTGSPPPSINPKQQGAASYQLAVDHPLRILVADDNLINQKVAAKMLESLGYKATLVDNGKAALSALESERYDLIFMDVQMPIMDGVQATEKIRDSLPLEDQPTIIALTANALAGDRERFLSAGMDDYLCKPLRMSELEATISRCIIPPTNPDSDESSIPRPGHSAN